MTIQLSRLISLTRFFSSARVTFLQDTLSGARAAQPAFAPAADAPNRAKPLKPNGLTSSSRSLLMVTSLVPRWRVSRSVSGVRSDRAAQQITRETMIISLVSKKGGVGKSTTAVNLAAALAKSGSAVLLIDLDPQASSSRSLGLERAQLAPSSADVLLNRLPIDRAARPTSVDGLAIVPASTDLADAEHRLSQLRSSDQQLKQRLERSRGSYEHILIDCPPALSLLPTNAIVASDAYVVPTTPHFLAQEGLDNLLAAAERAVARNHVSARCLGLLLTMVDRRVRLMRESTRNLRERFSTQVLESEIRFNSKLAEAPAFGQTIFQYAGSSGAALDYQRLAKEVSHLAEIRPRERERLDTSEGKGLEKAVGARRSWVPGFQPSAMESVG